MRATKSAKPNNQRRGKNLAARRPTVKPDRVVKYKTLLASQDVIEFGLFPDLRRVEAPRSTPIYDTNFFIARVRQFVPTVRAEAGQLCNYYLISHTYTASLANLSSPCCFYSGACMLFTLN